jgi:nucleoside-diphosphate-sugar epimerase
LESLYGPGDDVTKVPTYAARVCVADVAPLDLTPGEQMRDYIFIDDAVAAFRRVLASADTLPPGWHDLPLGSGRATTIREFVQQVHRASGATIALNVGALPYRDGELMRSCAETTALERLGWTPRVTLSEGIQRLVAHERALCGS